MRYIVFIAAILIATPATAQAGTSICFHMFGSEARSAMPPYVMNALAAINDRPALDPSDRRLFSEALNRAMVCETGSVSEWGDPAGQNHGQVLAGEDYERQNALCRSFDHTVFNWRASVVLQRHRLQGVGWCLARSRVAVERPICAKVQRPLLVRPLVPQRSRPGRAALWKSSRSAKQEPSKFLC
jgi:surface antigen